MRKLFVALLVMVGISTIVTRARAEDQRIHAELIGLREVPAVSTQASGEFKATIINDAAIDYEISYSGLESTVTQSHIHIGQRFVAGGITLWLCQTATNKDPTNLAPTCPQSGTVHALLTEKNIVGPATQGIAGGASGGTPAEFAEIVKLIRKGFTYANVHSTGSPSGEIRGQIRVDEGNGNKEKHDKN